ncbi:MAG: TldD/PmbA family protein [Pseudomonadales bacterium]|nr:TldD/PmbA family protein [Pseudomonadales bacterium]
MTEKQLAERVLAALQSAGFTKAAARASYAELHELQAENGELNLFRTNFETDITMTGISEQRRASAAQNRIDEDSVQQAAAELKLMAEGSQPDAAFDIAEAQPPQAFSAGPEKPDHDMMYDRLMALQDYVAQAYPVLNLRSAGVSFVRRRGAFLNTNGVSFETTRGQYQVSISFSSREGTNTSSMMYTGYSRFSLDEPIEQAINIDLLMKQSTEQTETRHIPGKFVGDLIFTPDCIMDFMGFLTGQIGDSAMVSDTSLYKGKVGEQVVSDLVTLDICPLSAELSGGYWTTGDGYAAENSRLIEAGVLRHYLLGLYGANKTGLPRAPNAGGCYVMAPGQTSLDDMISGISEGILMTRFSGGRPNDRGDVSGIAKNSYYIKDGKVQFPIRETTISGNIVSMLSRVNAVSSETINDGRSVLPWVRTTGVTVS